MSKNWKFETKAIRTRLESSQHREHSSSIYATSSFTFNDSEQMRAAFADEIEANIYSRFSNPNAAEFELIMAQLEGYDDGVSTASGMSAIFSSIAALLKQGDHVVVSRAIFGSTHQLFDQILEKMGITHTYVDADKLDTWHKAITTSTKMLFLESPTNPGLDIIDLAKAKKICSKYNLLYVVDNCFATPYLQKPKLFGADLVIHSATKFLDGQGRVLGGIVLGNKDLIKEIKLFCRKVGPSISPFNAWILAKSLETLAVRMDRHCENALQIANFLEAHSDVENVKYPFLPSHPQYEIAKNQMNAGGGLVAFTIQGGIKRGRKFLDTLNLCSVTANLGDTRTIVSHPSSTTHSKLTEKERLNAGITPGLLRISAGLEHIDDIIQDLNQAISAS